jgi:chemotaxis response regulator CheB
MGQGFKMIAENGGESIVQDCEAEFSVMPRSAIEIYKNHKVYTLNHIIKKINNYVN